MFRLKIPQALIKVIRNWFDLKLFSDLKILIHMVPTSDKVENLSVTDSSVYLKGVGNRRMPELDWKPRLLFNIFPVNQ